MDKTYKVYWSQTGLNELANMLAYPPEVKERIFNYSFTQLSHTPTLTAKQIPYSLDEYRKSSRGQFLHDEIIGKGTPIES